MRVVHLHLVTYNFFLRTHTHKHTHTHTQSACKSSLRQLHTPIVETMSGVDVDDTIVSYLVQDKDKAKSSSAAKRNEVENESRYEFLLRVVENVKTVAKEQLRRKKKKDEDKELETLETYDHRRKDAQFVLIELRRANRDALLELDEKKLETERKRKEVEKIGKKVLSAEYEKSHLTMEMQSRQGKPTTEDALRFDFVDEETFLQSVAAAGGSGDGMKNNKNAFAERRLEDELERRKELLERIEIAKKKKMSLQKSKLERMEKKREAENAIKDLKRTAAMVGEKFKTMVSHHNGK